MAQVPVSAVAKEMLQNHPRSAKLKVQILEMQKDLMLLIIQTTTTVTTITLSKELEVSKFELVILNYLLILLDRVTLLSVVVVTSIKDRELLALLVLSHLTSWQALQIQLQVMVLVLSEEEDMKRLLPVQLHLE